MPVEKFIKSSIYIVVAILALILFISQPYNFFCRETKICEPLVLSTMVPHQKGKQELNYHFSAVVPDDLKNMVSFDSKQKTIRVLNGQIIKNYYHVKNLTDKTITIKSMYKLTPFDANPYLERLECLCMKEQILKPHEEIDLIVRFRMNPKIELDDHLKSLQDLQISYQISLAE